MHDDKDRPEGLGSPPTSRSSRIRKFWEAANTQLERRGRARPVDPVIAADRLQRQLARGRNMGEVSFEREILELAADEHIRQRFTASRPRSRKQGPITEFIAEELRKPQNKEITGKSMERKLLEKTGAGEPFEKAEGGTVVCAFDSDGNEIERLKLSAFRTKFSTMKRKIQR